ncbi:syntaxin-5 [Anaeramoeba flamelloides]|uniref:Syntaxin-5 n=1 Tax=Anaeramoeba flamelloides TaxID=1746091 RepID=A0ABQ8XEQ4_9EUKA|nr:syntaxin-5 [Anaeramoeba flamelloides]
MATLSHYNNRTSEFFRIAQNIQENRSNLQTQEPVEKTKILNKNYDKFFQQASVIENYLQKSRNYLQELSRLSQESNLLQNHTSQIHFLSKEIKANIQTISQNLINLKKLCTKTSIESNQSFKHRILVFESLKNELTKLTKSFQVALEKETEILEKQEQRKSQFMSPNRSFMNFANPQNTLSYSTDQSQTPFEVEIIDPDENNYQNQNWNNHQNQRSTFRNRSYNEARVNVVEEIESTISEIGTVFEKMSSIVESHDHHINWIDQNMDETLYNINQGENELRKYFKSITSNRGLIIKIFAILIIFIIIFVLIM